MGLVDTIKRPFLERALVDAKDKLAYHKKEAEHFEISVKKLQNKLVEMGVPLEEQP